MVWIIIAGVLLIAFGPVLYMVPTRRDRRIARVRERARETGLVVELHPVRQTHPPPEARVTAGGTVRQPTYASVGYTLALGASLHCVAPWLVLRDPDSRTPVDGWVVESGQAESIVELSGLLDDLPADVVGVELKRRSLTCYWLETAPADVADVDRLKHSLARIGERIVALDAARARARDEQADS